MLSRRNIRVKVMQTVYSMEQESGDVQESAAEKVLRQKFEQSRKLMSYLVYFLTEVASYASKDADTRAGKYLPTEADLSINTKIAGNTVLQQIISDSGLQKCIGEFGFDQILDRDLVRQIYRNMLQTSDYLDYTETAERPLKQEKRILSFIFTNLMLPLDNFISHLEEHYINWDDDAECMDQIVQQAINKPVPGMFGSIVSKDKMEFAVDLLKTVISKNEYALELIKPKLKNWDAERIAALDMILLRMGVCEFLYFETIPTKVTINEYIDLAKSYSTPQSGQFVNGLLDNIHKDLNAENKIVKKVFKNSTL